MRTLNSYLRGGFDQRHKMEETWKIPSLLRGISMEKRDVGYFLTSSVVSSGPSPSSFPVLLCRCSTAQWSGQILPGSTFRLIYQLLYFKQVHENGWASVSSSSRRDWLSPPHRMLWEFNEPVSVRCIVTKQTHFHYHHRHQHHYHVPVGVISEQELFVIS